MKSRHRGGTTTKVPNYRQNRRTVEISSKLNLIVVVFFKNLFNSDKFKDFFVEANF